jgi:hypothetical protein
MKLVSILTLQLFILYSASCMPTEGLSPSKDVSLSLEVEKRQAPALLLVEVGLKVAGIFLQMAGVQAGSSALGALAQGLSSALGGMDGLPFVHLTVGASVYDCISNTLAGFFYRKLSHAHSKLGRSMCFLDCFSNISNIILSRGIVRLSLHLLQNQGTQL